MHVASMTKVTAALAANSSFTQHVAARAHQNARARSSIGPAGISTLTVPHTGTNDRFQFVPQVGSSSFSSQAAKAARKSEDRREIPEARTETTSAKHAKLKSGGVR